MPLFSLSYDASEESEFCLYRDYLAECSRDGFSLLDGSGAEVFRKNVGFNKPALFKRGEYLLVCDYGGRSAFVMKGLKPVWEETFTYGIVNASINKSGYMAFVLEADGYRNSVKVFAPIGKPLYEWVIADDYAIGAEVAPSGKALVINRLKTAGFGLSSGLEFLDMKSEPLMAIDSDEGEVFLSARYLDDNSIAAVSESMFRLYGEQGDPVFSEKFDSVTAICEFPRKKAAAAVWDGGRSSVVEYDAGLRKDRVLISSDMPVLSMSAEGEQLFVNYGCEIAVIKENGKIASRLKLDSEAMYGGASEKIGVLAVSQKSADVYAY
jgi:hypothetical protein